MTEYFPNPVFEEKVTMACEAPKPNPLFVSHLRARLIHQAATTQIRQPFWKRFGIALRRPVPAFALTALILVLLTTVVIGPQKVAAAVREIIGYIPGFGFVQDVETTIVLDAPVVVERDGIIVTVQEVVAGPERTDLLYQVEGIPQDKSQVQEPAAGPEQQPFLVLADGNKIPMTSGLSSTGQVTMGQYSFSPLPVGTTDATLVLPRLPVPFAGSAYDNWQIPLHLEPAPEAENVADSVDVGWSSEPVQGVTLRLEHVLMEPDQTVLQVSLVPADPGWQVIDWGELRLEDAAGKSYPLTLQPSAFLLSSSRIIKTDPIDPSQSLTLTLDGAEMRDLVPDPSAQFTFDPGREAAAGQTWDLDETVETAGFSVHITRASLVAGQNGPFELEFQMEPVPGLSGVALFSNVSNGGRWESPEPGLPYRSSLVFDGLPTHPFTIQLSPIFHISGSWKLTWKPQ